ncbi:TIGR03084 family metal-binding protein [Litorimonas sp. RW-G-Af-16]|uniref:TIGR03084 family metal-binding protein n=1 Tax=Litorimonas sp. RW-G-Af-16 TaxID=3241168 RepID=UPI00390C4C9D
MISEALDFRDESRAVYDLIKDLSPAQMQFVTQFKSWTIYDVIAHLHLWNMAADWTLNDPAKFSALMGQVIEVFQGGKTHQDLQREWASSQGLDKGEDLRAAWQNGYETVADIYVDADPDQRVKWGGPDMSARSCIIARQMETWAHAQAIYDVLGQERIDKDRLKNVAHIGVTTYSWSFKVNGRTPILPKPYVRLTSPEGGIWEWNDPQDENRLEGSATEFCQVVTQCRNIADTNLTTIGEAATVWMSIAQCFAGGAEMPPSQGQRHTKEN